MRTMLVDATPLLGESGMRGIGKYVRDLLHGLEETRDEWNQRISIRAALSFTTDSKPLTPINLAQAAEDAFRLRSTRSNAELSAERRLAFRSARAHGCDAVHITEPRAMPYRLDLPYVITCHDLIPLRMPRQYGGSFGRSKVHRIVLRRYYERAARVVAISRKTSMDLVELLGIRSASIDVIPHGLSWEALKEDADRADLRELGVPPAPYVIYAGYADYRKNAEGMIAALVHARTYLDVKLVWAGALPDEQRRRVISIATKLGVNQHVILVGYVADEVLMSLYRNALAHLFISRLEGFGYSVAEAMAAGCPVIVARGSGSDEVADHAGIHVDANDPRSAGDFIAKLYSDPSFRKSVADNGIERVKQFNKHDMARRYVETYVHALGGQP